MFQTLKSRKAWFKFMFILLALFVTLNAMAAMENHDDDLLASPTLSLHDLIERTLTRYPDSLVLQAKQVEIEARSKHAKGILPNSPAIGFRNQNDSVMSHRGEREWEAELEMSVWLPGQRAAREAIARDAAAGLIDAREVLHLQVAGMLRDSLWDLSMMMHQSTLAKSRHETALALLNDVEKRAKAGDLPRTDIMLAQNEAYQAETALLRAEAEVKHAKFRYKLLTGITNIPESFTELQSKAILADTHPALKDAASKIKVADDERNLVQVEKRENPSLLLNARTQRGAFDNQSNESVGFKVRIPFDTDVRSAPLLANAEMNYAKNQAESQHLRLMLESAFHEAEHNLEVTRAELEITTKQHANAQENLRLAKKAFALGESDLVNLLRVQALAYEAERAMKQRQIQLQWDTAHYNQAVGEMP